MTDQLERGPAECGAAPVTAAHAGKIGANGSEAGAGMAAERAKELVE
jgi:methanogenic corrinoid protein MtbC1